MENKIDQLFTRPTEKQCLESLEVLLVVGLKTELLKMQLLQPTLYQTLINQGGLNNLVSAIDMLLFDIKN